MSSLVGGARTISTLCVSTATEIYPVLDPSRRTRLFTRLLHDNQFEERLRLLPRLVIFGETCIKPLLGEERGGRRSNRVFPEQRVRTSQITNLASRDEPVTTARPSPQRTSRPAPARRASTPANVGRSGSTSDGSDSGDAQDAGSGPGVVRQWVSELAGAARPNAGAAGGTVRVPTEAEIETLTAMFPDVGRDVVLGVLQRSPNIETAAETLLTSARA